MMKSFLRPTRYLLALLNLLALSVAAAPVMLVDTGMAASIKMQIKMHQKELYYPLSVLRFYKSNGNKLVWVAPDTVKTHATDAMLLLDCVVQYGLNHADYHPNKLLYDELNLLTSSTAKVSNERKAMFDIWLTDAILTFENNLHYGRLNPDYTARKIDAKEREVFNSMVVLNDALKSKEFKKTITLVQPKSKIYQDLKYQMYLETGLYTSDCYEFPEAEIQRMAINMERLRWYSVRKKEVMEINIPSRVLTIHFRHNDYHFKLKMSKSVLHALAKQSIYPAIMTISVVHRQPILHITPAIRKDLQELNNIPQIKTAKDEPFNILVFKSKELSALLTSLDVEKIKVNSNPVNFTYITCEIKEGELVNYKDIYGLDNGLQLVLYHAEKK
ncbi:hypothetical protein [Mucilaginibacter sp.]|jgi:murein L,D-transpeptidase YcbB/YkuD|uniref:hypothetical protein n=1 Tax=Mucilaginibacter sp. TaxID=1882438 RepID=UPI00356622DE